MCNHFYSIGGIKRKQADRGAIASDMTGEVSRMYMLDWDEVFMNKLKDVRIDTDLYGRYADNKTIVACEIKRGWRFNPKREVMEFSWDRWESDRDEHGG